MSVAEDTTLPTYFADHPLVSPEYMCGRIGKRPFLLSRRVSGSIVISGRRWREKLGPHGGIPES